MKLAQGEKIIKEWTYATAGESKKTLTATNKRLIHRTTCSDSVNQYEVPMRNINSVSFNSTTIISGGSPFLVILGIILMITAVVIMIASGSGTGATILIGVIGIVIGLVLLIVGLIKHQRTLFGLVITTNSGVTYNEGVSANRKNPADISMTFNVGVTEDIVDTLGAIIEDSNVKSSVNTGYYASHTSADTTDEKETEEEEDYSYLD